jgi:hypothetical protein
MFGTTAVIVVQLVPQGKVMFLLGIEKIVAGFCDQVFKKGSKNKTSKNLHLIRSVLIQKWDNKKGLWFLVGRIINYSLLNHCLPTIKRNQT